MVQLYDTLDAATTARICADGCLVADVRAARVGIQEYLPSEAGAPSTFKGDRVRVYRPEEEVFHRDSMASFAAAPFTIDHPSQPVTADNWRRLGVGEVNGDVIRDGGFVRVPVIVRDAAAVEKVRTTHKQLSMGYSCSLDWTPGTTPDGQAYDAVQRNIRINHIAAVPAARGGPELKISDERPPQNKEHPTMKIRIGDAEVDPTNGEAVRIAVDGLNAKLADATARAAKAEEQVATLTTEKATADAKVVTLEKQLADAALTPAKLRDAAKAYAATVDKAKALGVTVTDAMDEAAIQRAVVSAKLGDAAKDWSDEQVAASFSTLAAGVKASDTRPDPLRSVISDGVRSNVGDTAATRNAARAARYV